MHCASADKGDAEATQNLVRAASSLPAASHDVYVSIVAVARLSFNYVRSKLDSERLVTDSGLSWTILRATRVYAMIFSGATQLAKLPLVPAPAGFEVQPIDPNDGVTTAPWERLVGLAPRSAAGDGARAQFANHERVLCHARP